MRKQSEPYKTDAASDQRLLARPRHSHRDIRVAAQQVLVAVRQRKLDLDVRIARGEPGKDRRQYLVPDDLARRRGRDRPARRAREQARAEESFERLDVTAGGGLRQPQATRCGRETAVADHREESPVEVPAGLGAGDFHAFMYITSTDLCNSICP